jgi:hypothetical protein
MKSTTEGNTMRHYDFRLEIITLEEPEMGETHLVNMIELVLVPANDQWPVDTIIDGDLIESFTTDDPHGTVEAAREAQMYTLEERFDRYAEMGL